MELSLKKSWEQANPLLSAKISRANQVPLNDGHGPSTSPIPCLVDCKWSSKQKGITKYYYVYKSDTTFLCFLYH